MKSCSTLSVLPDGPLDDAVIRLLGFHGPDKFFVLLA